LRLANHELVILPLSERKLRKNALSLNQSAFSNFALYVIIRDTIATFHMLFFGKILSEQFRLMANNKKSRDIGETV